MTLDMDDVRKAHEEGIKLRSEIENIVYAKILEINEDGTLWVEEVDKDIGVHKYNTPLEQIDGTFFIPQ